MLLFKTRVSNKSFPVFLWLYVDIVLILILNRICLLYKPILYYNYYDQLFPIYLFFNESINYTPEQLISQRIQMEYSSPANDLASFSKNIKKTLKKKYDKKALKTFSSLFLWTKTTLITLNNVYGNSRGSWAFNGTLINLPRSSYKIYYYPIHFQINRGILRYYVKEMLLIGHKRCQNNYAHFLADKLAPLMIVPQELKERCFIIGNSNFPVIKEGLIALGFRESQILDCPTKFVKDWFFAEKLHVFTDYRPMNSFGGPPCEMLREHFFNYYNLDLIDATIYGMVNRQSKTRNIENFNELYNLTIEMFPTYNWKQIPDYAGNLSYTAKLWTSLKFSFAMTGSTCSKGIFMKPYTVLCIPTCEELDFTIMNLLVGSNHAVRIFPTGFKHYVKGTFPINIEEAIQSIKECLYYDSHKKWSSSA